MATMNAISPLRVSGFLSAIFQPKICGVVSCRLPAVLVGACLLIILSCKNV